MENEHVVINVKLDQKRIMGILSTSHFTKVLLTIGSVCKHLKTIPLMYGPDENSFVFLRVLMFLAMKSREILGLKGKQN